jgi:shikimate kinase
MPDMNIYLIGFRCTGKTTLGKVVARRLGWPFVDMDDVLVAESGMTISEMVQQHGWPHFREKEGALMQRLCRQTLSVVGTGGGVVLDAVNVAAMRQSGKVIWLRSRPETIGRYLAADHRTADLRPSLTEKGLQAEIRETLAQRAPLYQSAMHAAVDTDNWSIEDLCNLILVKCRGLGLDI